MAARTSTRTQTRTAAPNRRNALVPLNEGLRGSLEKQDLAPVIQPPNTPPTNRCTEAFRRLKRVTPPMSRSLPVVAASDGHNNDLLDPPVRRPTETDGQSSTLTTTTAKGYEGLDKKPSTEKMQSSPPRGVSTLHPSLLSVFDSLGTRDTEIIQVPSRMGGQGEPNSLPRIASEFNLIYNISIVITQNSTARTDHDDNENLVSLLLKEQRDLKASFNRNAQLPDVGAPSQRSQRPKTRSRRPKRPIARNGGPVSPDSTSALQATTSKTSWKRRRVDLRPIRKHYLRHPLPLTLTNKLT